MDPVAFVNKWLHLGSMVGMLGGLAFGLLVLAPGLRANADEELAKSLWKRFGITVGILWIVVLATGFLNMYLVTPSVNGKYQMFLGMKMALAIVMFVGTMLLAHPAPGLSKLTSNRGSWLSILVILGAVVLGLSAFLNISRINGTGLKPASVTSTSAPTDGLSVER
jgi:putative copper export protein